MIDNQTRDVPGFLRGVVVAEFGDGLAGAAATAMLAALGADVTTMSDSNSLLRRRAPAVTGDGPHESVLSAILDADKKVSSESIPTAPLVVVVDRCEGSGPLSDMPVEEYLDHVDARNASVWVTVSPYGLTGPQRRWRGTELTIAAAGGLLSAVTDHRTGSPIKLAGNQALLSAGQVAALAACQGIAEYTRTAKPVHLDVSAQEAVVVTGPLLRVTNILLNSTGESGARRYGAPAGYFQCRDGLVRISVMEDHQWSALVRAIDAPAWTESFTDGSERIARADELDANLAAELANWSMTECERRLQEEGVPIAAMYSAEDLADSPHFAARGALRDIVVGATSLRTVGLPFNVQNSAAPGRDAPAGLRGLRIAEAGHVLAAPLAGALLGAIGASVTKVEDPERLDIYRRRGPYIDGVASPDHSAYFAAMNHSKLSMVVPMSRNAEALARLVADSDVVLENFGQRRARRIGIDATTLLRARPDMLAVSSSGFGYEGPWSAYRAYAYNLHTAGGLAYLTRGSDGEAADLDLPWADLISGVMLATIIAAWAVGPNSRSGAAVDFSMLELVASRFNEFLATAHADIVGAGPEDASNHLVPFTPHGVYATATERQWVSLAVWTDEQWRAVCAALGAPASLTSEAFASAELRKANEAELDRVLQEAMADADAVKLVSALQATGVAAAQVMAPEDLVVDRHLRTRTFFRRVDHPAWGSRRLVGIPWNIVGGRVFTLGPPPLLQPVEK
ncbi:MAG: CoA transferase [Mycobacterium sp.]